MEPHAKAKLRTADAEILNMISEGGPVQSAETATERAKRRWPRRAAAKENEAKVEAAQPDPRGWLGRRLDHISENIGRRYLELLGGEGRVSETVRGVPKRMRKVANQTQLVVELLDDVRDGTYRQLPWRSLAILSAGLLYSVSPADVIPEFIPLLGALDDMVVMALATRWVERDLRAYCRFKGYSESAYF